jgi:hypothetical protein
VSLKLYGLLCTIGAVALHSVSLPDSRTSTSSLDLRHSFAENVLLL